MSLLALDKWARMFRMFKQNGGIIRSLIKIWKMDTLKEGRYVGKDIMGNRYFENKNYMIGRCRWVEYNPAFRFEYDATHVSPEWYGWLHYKTDKLPNEDWAKYCLKCCSWCQRWLLPPEENMSGTPCAYYPYSTVRPNIYVWDGHSICNRTCRPE